MSIDIFIPLRTVLSHPGQFHLKAELNGCTHGAFSEYGEDEPDLDYIQYQLEPVLLCKFGARDSWRVVDIGEHWESDGASLELHISCNASFYNWLISWLNEHNHSYRGE